MTQVAETKEYVSSERLREIVAGLEGYGPDDKRVWYSPDLIREAFTELLERRASDKPSEAVRPDGLVAEFAEGYEWDDGEGYHVPTEQERLLIIDALHGFIFHMHEKGLFTSSEAGSGVNQFIAAAKLLEDAGWKISRPTQPAESAKSGDGVTITEERIERAARAIMERDVCGYTINGLRCLCDDALSEGLVDGYNKPLRQSICGCRESAKAALTAALAEVSNAG